MNRLQTEFQRLYAIDEASAAGADTTPPRFTDDEGRVRALVIELARPADWAPLALLWHGVQDDLGLPAPAIVVNGVDGFQLWFSLAEAVAAADAQLFLERLRLRYLGDVASARITLQPALEMVPTLKKASGQWSAFIARDLAAVCADEPWLDLCPGAEAQAEVLSRLKSIKSADFRVALERLGPAEQATVARPTPVLAEAVRRDAPARSLDPKQFLLEAMGDASLAMHLRIAAAQALLPYFEKPRG